MSHRFIGPGILLAAALGATAGFAADARCSTTDDGDYPCQFRMTDKAGSFEISAPGKPTYMLNVGEPGVAFGFTILGDSSVPLPGRYERSKTDAACWLNDTTSAKICAW